MQWPINICKKCVSSSFSQRCYRLEAFGSLDTCQRYEEEHFRTRYIVQWWQSWWIPTTFKRIFLTFSISHSVHGKTQKWQSQLYSKPTSEVTSPSHLSNCSSSRSSVFSVDSVVLHMLIFIEKSFISIEIKRKWVLSYKRSKFFLRSTKNGKQLIWYSILTAVSCIPALLLSSYQVVISLDSWASTRLLWWVKKSFPSLSPPPHEFEAWSKWSKRVEKYTVYLILNNHFSRLNKLRDKIEFYFFSPFFYSFLPLPPTAAGIPLFVVRMVDMFQVNTHDQIDDLFSNKTWGIMARTEGVASRWTTDHTSVFFHLPFFIFMLVSIDLLFLLPFTYNNWIEHPRWISYRISFQQKNEIEKCWIDSPYFISPFPSHISLLFAHHFLWLIFLVGTSLALHHFSFLWCLVNRSIAQLEIDPTNECTHAFIVVKWWTSALASTMPVPSGTFIPVFKVRLWRLDSFVIILQWLRWTNEWAVNNLSLPLPVLLPLTRHYNTWINHQCEDWSSIRSIGRRSCSLDIPDWYILFRCSYQSNCSRWICCSRCSSVWRSCYTYHFHDGDCSRTDWTIESLNSMYNSRPHSKCNSPEFRSKYIWFNNSN